MTSSADIWLTVIGPSPSSLYRMENCVTRRPASLSTWSYTPVM